MTTKVSTNMLAGGNAFPIPSGTTAARPGSPTAGMIRYNTELGYPEWHNGSGVVIVSYPSSTQRGSGGTVTSYSSNGNTYWVHTFTTSGTFTA